MVCAKVIIKYERADMENILQLKTLNELSTYSFFIPAYQRGYKWTEKEVIDLLTDIDEFTPRLIDDVSGENTWYCLQPIVVKKLQTSKYEVIDGQQRLTTIFLILNYLNQDFVKEKRDRLFELDYETRAETKSFLEDLENTKMSKKNVDFHHIHRAYKTISDWFGNRESDASFDKQNFRSKFKFNSKIIWYESNENDPIKIFTRINIGKIPLTNSELIKALFLNSANFKDRGQDKVRLKQLEIASEWDIIEHSLQNDRFWYFLTGGNECTNRIEFLFDLINEASDEDDQYATFRYFSKKFSPNTQEVIERNWKEVKDYYQRFLEWFEERELYHKIGYILCTQIASIGDLYSKSYVLTKSEFKEFLDSLIRNDLHKTNLDELQYGDKNVKKVLLLYNILTMLANSSDNSLFPFENFIKGNWDIEHITSVKDTIPSSNKEEWLKDAIVYIDTSKKLGKQLKERAKGCNCKDEKEFKEIFEALVLHFNSEVADEDINDLSNLTLLDSETNRGYKNAVFPFKRKTIIDKDKSGVFIPICTKNVFLKYFSDYPPKISFWTQDDRQKYEEDLYKTLQGYLGKE